LSEHLTVLVASLPVPPERARTASEAATFATVVRRQGGEVTVGAPPGTHEAVFVGVFEAARVALGLAQAGCRVGLYRGDATGRAGRYEGPAVDAARALHALGTEGVALPAGVAGAVGSLLPAQGRLDDLGSHALTGRGPERAFAVCPPSSEAGGTDAATPGGHLSWPWRWAPPSLVGRDDTLAALRLEWEAAGEEARCRLAVLSGEAGIGKTTLAVEFALQVHAEGAGVLYGRWDGDAVEDYAGIREALWSYADSCPVPVLKRDLADHVGEIARLLPGVGPRLGGVRAPLPADPDSERRRLFDAVTTWLARMAARHPVLVVLDDLHWAERSSLALLRHVLTHLRAPVVLLATVRSDEADDMGPLHELTQVAKSAHLVIDGLETAEVEELVRANLGRPVAVDEAGSLTRLSEETSGNPLYLTEVLRHLADEPGTDLGSLAVTLPDRVQDVVRWRLETLPAAAVEALEVAALVGERFRTEVVAAVVGRDPLALRRDLDLARRASVVHEVPGPVHRLGFSHGIVRRVLGDGIAPDRARDLHARVGLTLAERAQELGAPAAEVARHLLRGERDHAQAVRWAREAAEEARRETAFESAVDLLSRAVELDARHGDDLALSCALRLELAEAHDRAGEFTARDQRFREAAELADRLDRDDLYARAALGYGGRLPSSPIHNPEAVRLLTEALDRLGPEDSRNRALALARLASVQHNVVPHQDRRRMSDEAVAIARRLKVPSVLLSTMLTRVQALEGPDDVDTGLETGREVMRTGARIGDVDMELQGAKARLTALLATGAVESARDLGARFVELATANQHPEHLRIRDMWCNMLAAIEGRWDDFESGAAALEAQLIKAGHDQGPFIVWSQWFPVRWVRGRLDEGRPQIAAINEAVPNLPIAQALLAAIDASCGDLAGVARMVDGGELGRLDEVERSFLWVPMTAAAAIAASLLGDVDWADHVASLLAPYAERHCVMGYACFMGHTRYHLGALATTAGRHDEAVRHLELAVTKHDELGSPPFVALAQRALARALAARAEPGDGDQARSLVAASEPVIRAHGLGGPSFAAPFA